MQNIFVFVLKYILCKRAYKFEMFKKKPNIPPRPKPPITEQVLDDLKNAPEDDVFILRDSVSGR